MTKVGLLNTATASAKETAPNNELYEMIPEPEDSTPADLIEPQETACDPDRLAWDQRWTYTAYRDEPSEQIEDVAAAIWPDPSFSAVFRIKAGYRALGRLVERTVHDNLKRPCIGLSTR